MTFNKKTNKVIRRNASGSGRVRPINNVSKCTLARRRGLLSPERPRRNRALFDRPLKSFSSFLTWFMRNFRAFVQLVRDFFTQVTWPGSETADKKRLSHSIFFSLFWCLFLTKSDLLTRITVYGRIPRKKHDYELVTITIHNNFFCPPPHTHLFNPGAESYSRIVDKKNTRLWSKYIPRISYSINTGKKKRICIIEKPY